MITEDYVSYEVAKLLKEKGFDYQGFDYIDFEGEVIRQDRPTHQMAMKWLRKKYCLHFVIQPMMSMPSCELKWVADTYDTSIFYKGLSEFRCVAGTKLCDSPEEAVEAALKYSLENLI